MEKIIKLSYYQIKLEGINIEMEYLGFGDLYPRRTTNKQPLCQTQSEIATLLGPLRVAKVMMNML